MFLDNPMLIKRADLPYGLDFIPILHQLFFMLIWQLELPAERMATLKGQRDLDNGKYDPLYEIKYEHVNLFKFRFHKIIFLNEKLHIFYAN